MMTEIDPDIEINLDIVIGPMTNIVMTDRNKEKNRVRDKVERKKARK